MAKQMILFPTFDGQLRSIAAIGIDAIDMIKPAMTPGTCNIYVSGDGINVHFDMNVLLEKLKAAGVNFVDLSDGAGYAKTREHDH